MEEIGQPKFPTPVIYGFLLRYAYYILSNMSKDIDQRLEGELDQGDINALYLALDIPLSDQKVKDAKELLGLIQERRRQRNRALEIVEFTLEVFLPSLPSPPY